MHYPQIRLAAISSVIVVLLGWDGGVALDMRGMWMSGETTGAMSRGKWKYLYTGILWY